MSARLAVSPARWGPAAAALLRPSHVATFRSPGAEPTRLDAPGLEERLDLVFHDIAGPRTGLLAPSEGAVAELVRFARGWSGERPLLLSCHAGVSRSTAAAYVVACLKTGRGEAELARALRAAAPSATPNPLVVALGDAALGRGGRMAAAVAAIGRGRDCFEGESLVWDLGDGAAQSLTLMPSSTAASAACSTAPSTSPV